MILKKDKTLIFGEGDIIIGTEGPDIIFRQSNDILKIGTEISIDQLPEETIRFHFERVSQIRELISLITLARSNKDFSCGFCGYRFIFKGGINAIASSKIVIRKLQMCLDDLLNYEIC